MIFVHMAEILDLSERNFLSALRETQFISHKLCVEKNVEDVIFHDDHLFQQTGFSLTSRMLAGANAVQTYSELLRLQRRVNDNYAVSSSQ